MSVCVRLCVFVCINYCLYVSACVHVCAFERVRSPLSGMCVNVRLWLCMDSACVRAHALVFVCVVCACVYASSLPAEM